MSGFLRFTLLVAALCAAAVFGYVVGVRNSGPSAPPAEGRMSIDTHGGSEGASARDAAPRAAPPPEPKPAEAAPRDPDAQNAAEDAGPPTSIDEILRRQQAAPAPHD